MNQHSSCTHGAKMHRAFTLIEILIVIGLSALLFALLLVPLVSAIKYTREVQSLTAAQDAIRITRERLTRELSSAVFVFDNTSHPFVFATAAAPGDDLATNFLNLDIPTSTAGTNLTGHAYNAKLDFALPRVSDTGVKDPTTGDPVAYHLSGSGSAVIVSPAQVFPAAAGITMVRYWIGLQDPTKPYNNPREGQSGSGDTNTYVLYRAQFQPYKQTTGSAYGPNTDLFATRVTAGATTPDLDDPNFFRYVQDTDIDWLDAAHRTFAATGNKAAHNARVDKWQSIAKPVIPGPNIDLLLLPHNTDNTVNYDTGSPGPCTAAACPGTAHYGIAHDPVTSKYYPIVNTSITFRPGTVSGDATPATTNSYTSAGVPLESGNNGFAYIPTVYTATAKSWSLPYKVTLTPPSAPAGQITGGDTFTTGLDPATGDTYEYNSAGTAVFDLTTGVPLSGATTGGRTSYIPLGINADSGTISFDTPSFPNPATAATRYQREWNYIPTAAGGGYQVDLTVTGTDPGPSPLGTIVDATANDSSATPVTGNPIPTARIVPGSVRVYGPDGTAGPGRYQPGVAPTDATGNITNQPLVLYTETSSLGSAGDNLYLVDYSKNTIQLLGNADQFGAAVNPAPVRIIYNYQANMAPVGTKFGAAASPPFQIANPTETPMNVSVDYRTRDLMDISLAVRIYDLSTGRAQVIPSEFKAKIGNSNR